MKRALVIIFLAAGFFVVQTLYRAGQFKSIEDKFSGTISKVYTNVPGPEDFQLDRLTGNLYISGTDRRGDNVHANGIYMLSVDSGESPVKMETDYPGQLNPHGISLLRKDSSLYLLAVNHNKEGDFVEFFEVEGNILSHFKSISNDEMCCPNDLVALDLDKIYISNDHGAKKGVGRVIEDYLNIPSSSIFYYDGEDLKKIAKPFYYANGINISPDGSKLYLAETTGKSITTFEIHEDGTLLNLGSYDVGTGVDNIDVDNEGNLWVAAHPKLLDYVNHRKDSTNVSPSQVLKLTPVSATNFKEELIYQDSGNQLSGSSIAVYYKGEMFVGVVLNHSILRAGLN